MDEPLYLTPVADDILNKKYLPGQWGANIYAFPKNESLSTIKDYSIALIGVCEDRRSSENQGCSSAPDAIRHHFYQLFQGNHSLKIIDLGNILQGHTPEDTYFALRQVCSSLIRKKIIPMVMGGSQDLTLPLYQAFQDSNQIINLVSVDPVFDMGMDNEDITSDKYLQKIILSEPNYLFNYTQLGYQTYLVNPASIELMKKLLFDTYRLGWVREHLDETEPVVRYADMISMDMTAVRRADAPGAPSGRPNGFYAEEFCTIARFAGMSDKMACFGLFEVNPVEDPSGQTAMLAAQVLWFFTEGVASRKLDYPVGSREDYLKYIVPIKDHSYEIVFYKSKKSDRWWMEIPFTVKKANIERHHLVPCSYHDYQVACQDELPDRWWQFYSKFQ